jgi:hypothetical protein
MSGSLPEMFGSLHRLVEQELGAAREALRHPGTKGDASEEVWRKLLGSYLPKRYKVAKAQVVDSKGAMSEQIDVLVFDRQYSPFMFDFHGASIVPAESVYAVFEAKQTANAAQITYAQKKVESVRKLHRTSLPIPTANGTVAPKKPGHIWGGFLSLESDWNPAMGDPLLRLLRDGDETLDIGCIAGHGVFTREIESGEYTAIKSDKAATMLLFELIARLQMSATVPMIDVRAYSAYL